MSVEDKISKVFSYFTAAFSALSADYKNFQIQLLTSLAYSFIFWYIFFPIQFEAHPDN